MCLEVNAMRIKTSKSKNPISYSVIKDVYINGKRTTQVVKAQGDHEEILEKTLVLTQRSGQKIMQNN